VEVIVDLPNGAIVSRATDGTIFVTGGRGLSSRSTRRSELGTARAFRRRREILRRLGFGIHGRSRHFPQTTERSRRLVAEPPVCFGLRVQD
jgi:hypothetical protein